MTFANHLITGAAIAASVNKPALAIPLAFISHFVTDAIPHFGHPDDSKDIFKRNKRRSFQLRLGLSFVLGVCLIAYFYSSFHIDPWVLTACLIAANLPDIIWVYRFIGEIFTQQEKPRGRFSEFHVRIQRDTLVLGAINEIVWFALMLVLILHFR